jgi:hypothetical protein
MTLQPWTSRFGGISFGNECMSHLQSVIYVESGPRKRRIRFAPQPHSKSSRITAVFGVRERSCRFSATLALPETVSWHVNGLLPNDSEEPGFTHRVDGCRALSGRGHIGPSRSR